MHTHGIHIRRYLWLCLVRYGIAVWILTSIVSNSYAQSVKLNSLHHELIHQRDSMRYVDVLTRISLLHHMDDADSCLLYAIKAREIADRIHYTKGQADVWNILSITHLFKNNLKSAVEAEYHALKLYRDLGDSGLVSQVLCNLGAYQYYYSPPERKTAAYPYLYAALDIIQALPPKNDSFRLLIMVNYINWFSDDSTRKDSVKWAMNEIRRITVRNPLSRARYYVEIVVADSLVKAGKGREAEIRINELSEGAIKNGSLLDAYNIYNQMDKYRLWGYPSDSIYYWEKMYQIGKQVGYTAILSANLELLYNYYSKGHHPEKMTYYTGEIAALARKLQQQPPPVNYADYFMKVAAEENQQKENRVQRQRIRQMSQRADGYRVAVVGLLIAAGLLSLLAFFKSKDYRATKRHEKELKDKHAVLLAIQQELETNDTFKNNLITIIANDFRLPLLHISEVAKMLKNSRMNEQEMLRTLEEIAAASRHTLTVFDHILRWIKSQLSGFVFVPQPCMLDEMIREAIASIAATLGEKQVAINEYVPGGMVVAADPEMLQFVHRHLLSAAIAASAVKNTITIMAGRETAALYVDTGLTKRPGLESDAASWFQLPAHTDGPLRPPLNSPLMLIICKDFMIKMKGDIWAVDKPDGTLSFIYSLPELV